MKQKDMALIGVVVIVSALISLFISNALFSGGSKTQSVETAPNITTEFTVNKNPNYFAGGFDPTQLIQIGPNDNTNPFSE